MNTFKAALLAVLLAWAAPSFASNAPTVQQEPTARTSVHTGKASDSKDVDTQACNGMRLSQEGPGLVAQSRKPPCCGECRTNDNGARGCNVYIDRQWTCSSCQD